MAESDVGREISPGAVFKFDFFLGHFADDKEESTGVVAVCFNCVCVSSLLCPSAHVSQSLRE